MGCLQQKNTSSFQYYLNEPNIKKREEGQKLWGKYKLPLEKIILHEGTLQLPNFYSLPSDQT